MNLTEVPTWTLQERLAKAREHAHLDRHQMAARLGVSERTIRNWEGGAVEPTPTIVLAYSAVTHVPLVWLTGELPDPGLNPAFTQQYRQHSRLTAVPAPRILKAA